MTFIEEAATRKVERDHVIRFIRKYTHLQTLADMLDEAVHLRSEAQVHEWASAHGFSLRKEDRTA